MSKYDITFPWKYRILLIIFVIVFLGCVFINQKCSPEKSQSPEDTNVYLNETVGFGTDYEIKVIGINVEKDETAEGKLDEDDEALSSYTLNLTINIKKISNKNFLILK